MGGNFRVSEGFSRVPRSHRGKGPKNYTRSDEQITHEASQRLMDHDGIDASDIEVALEGGDATLNGTVPTLQMKRMAGELVEDTGGVSNCQNNLRVATTGAKRLDGAAWDEPRG
ncbi:MAG: BON domain-containing protein [Deltaproteobacteria bacterium]|nr:BON domain-containing protein [Deltaproteobacteria bacterium]